MIDDLDALWAYVENLTRRVDPHSDLPPVMGGGQTHRPRLALVFINPTHRNASTRNGWAGPRYPFIGTKAVWRVLAQGQLLPATVADEIVSRPTWDEEFAASVYSRVEASSLYLTNLVKWTGPTGDLPSGAMVKTYADILRRELELVCPEAVVAFGGLTYRALTGEAVRLSDVLQTVRTEGRVPSSRSRFGIPVYPCYFPVGRGNPRSAAEILAALTRSLEVARNGAPEV